MSVSKKFIAVRSDLLQKIIEIANKKGKTVYGFVNEICEQATKADEMNSTLDEILEFYRLIKTMRQAGAVMMPPEILDHSIKHLYPLKKKALLENWYNSGLWFGKFLETKFDDPLKIFREILTTCLWDITEANIEPKENNISLRVVAPNLPRENTELLLQFISGVMHTLDYKVIKQEYWKGIILLELRKIQKIPDIETELDEI